MKCCSVSLVRVHERKWRQSSTNLPRTLSGYSLSFRESCNRFLYSRLYSGISLLSWIFTFRGFPCKISCVLLYPGLLFYLLLFVSLPIRSYHCLWTMFMCILGRFQSLVYQIDIKLISSNGWEEQ